MTTTQNDAPEKDTIDKEKEESVKEPVEETSESENQNSETDEPNEEMPEEWKDKFEKQRAGTYQKLEESAKKQYDIEKNFVQRVPGRLKELAYSDDDKDVKVAERLAKEEFGKSLKEAIASLSVDQETDEEKEMRIKKQAEIEITSKFLKEQFVSENQILNPDSPDYNADISEKYESKLKILKGNGDILSYDSLKQAHDEAFYLATRGLEKEIKHKETEEVQRKIASAGSGSNTKVVTPKSKGIWSGFDKTL